jgi:hypothetical protein
VEPFSPLFPNILDHDAGTPWFTPLAYMRFTSIDPTPGALPLMTLLASHFLIYKEEKYDENYPVQIIDPAVFKSTNKSKKSVENVDHLIDCNAQNYSCLYFKFMNIKKTHPSHVDLLSIQEKMVCYSVCNS